MATNTATLKSELGQMSGQFSTFFVDDLFFGVDVLDVQEVLRAQLMTSVPQAPDVIEGLINLRGQIVTAIDMRRRLMLPPRDGDQAPMNIVVRTSDGAISLLVDEIGDVLQMDAATFERPPENLDPAARELIRGVYKLSDGLLLVLDTEKAVDVCTYQNSVKANAVIQAGGPVGRRGASPSVEVSPEDQAGAVKQPARNSGKRGSRKGSGKKVDSSKHVSVN